MALTTPKLHYIPLSPSVNVLVAHVLTYLFSMYLQEQSVRLVSESLRFRVSKTQMVLTRRPSSFTRVWDKILWYRDIRRVAPIVFLYGTRPMFV